MAAVLGIDLSLTRTGVCDGLGKGTYLLLSDMTWHQACSEVISWTLTRVGPQTLVVIEMPFMSHLNYVMDLIMMHGALRRELEKAEVDYRYLPPASLKVVATGNGKATKADMRMEWFRRGGTDLVDDNAVDAQWLWVAGMLMLGYNVLQLPKSHVRGIEKNVKAQGARRRR